MNVLNVFVDGVLLMAAAVLCHEGGHYIIARLSGLKPRVVALPPIRRSRWLLNCWDVGVMHSDPKSDPLHALILIAGPVVGFLPILWAILGNLFWIIILIPYIYGCRNDIERTLALMPDVW
jgi:hypothetical protein